MKCKNCLREFDERGLVVYQCVCGESIEIKKEGEEE